MGYLKQWFKILRFALPYPYRTQVRIVVACCILHNFIHRYNRRDWYFEQLENWINPDPINDKDKENPDNNVSFDKVARGDALRQFITEKLRNKFITEKLWNSRV